ncbi:MAG: tetratricopeptide repeat protein [Anaerolineales bacterium]|nr:tetratricopeptide repeat protein [Anaerolineales bacterium]
MAKITLRAYYREIEAMLDRSQFDEAVAHCHHILKIYPKNLAVYRLLGKTLLEAKRYGDATDVFSRALAAAPSDFVSHVGMSLIRDEENRLDDAIWHMERAFEAQPSNAAVQSELQRLYTRRDGSAPPRIRMTRGALAHMYVKGELYPQAISEIKSALMEDPGRADMEALLARAYSRSGQKTEATETCSSLLRRYPYCYDANAILVDILDGERPESVQANRQRVVELDPYAAHVSGSLLDVSAAPDTAVSIERLDWQGQLVGLPSGWSESQGIQLPSETANDQPEWLTNAFTEADTTLPSAPQAALAMGAFAQPQEDIPDFLRDAGWGASTGAFDESKSSILNDEEPLPAAAADMPDWVKAMAPAESEISSADESTPDWMDRIDPSILSAESKSAAASDQPDWLSELGATPQEPVQSVETTSDQPDWLKDLGAMPQEPAQSVETTSDLPDWLKDTSAKEPEPISNDFDSLKQTEQPQESEPIEASSASHSAASAPSAQAEDDAFAWLESLAVKQGSTEGLLLKPEDRPQEEPEWVKQVKSTPEDAPLAQTPSIAAAEETPVASVGDLEELGKSEKEQDDSFAWLESLAVKQGSTEGLLITPEERNEDEPEWVRQAKEIGDSLTASAREHEVVDSAETPAVALEPQAMSEDTGMWLRSLESETLIVEPAQSSEDDDVATWLKKLDEPEESSVGAERQDDVLPDWMKTAEASDRAEFDKSASQPFASKAVDESALPQAERVSEGDLPSWLEGIDAGAPAAAISDDLPVWLRDEAGETVAEPAKIEPTRAEEWHTLETHAVEPVASVEEKPQMATPKPPARKTVEAKKTAPIAARPQEPAVRKGTGSLAYTVDIALGQARNELNRSNIPGALERYSKLIKKGRYLDDIISDLRDASYRYPVEVGIWQALGDAYMRGNRLQDALDSYTKAEELLR